MESIQIFEHPISALVKLIEESDRPPDAETEHLFERVKEGFGPIVAIAALKGQLKASRAIQDEEVDITTEKEDIEKTVEARLDRLDLEEPDLIENGFYAEEIEIGIDEVATTADDAADGVNSKHVTTPPKTLVPVSD